MPDSTTNGNFQIVELPKRGPGHQARLLLQPNHTASAEPGFLGFLANGSPDRFNPIPLDKDTEVRVKGDSLFFTDLKGFARSELIPAFLLPLDKYAPQALAWKEETGKPYLISGEKVTYIDSSQAVTEADLVVLRAQITNELVETRTFRLGTDAFGRDVLSRLILGTRVSLSVGLLAVLVSLLLGITLGAAAGFFRGKVDAIIMWFVSVVWSIPTLLLAISISFMLEKGFWQVFLAIGVSMWVEVARIVRGQIFSLREMQYVEATRALGYNTFRAISRHILPNILSPILIISAANFASAILIEAGLSFLGAGIKSPTPSWGAMISEGYEQIIFESGAYLAIFPGLAIILIVISLNLVGFGLRDALDPKYDH